MVFDFNAIYQVMSKAAKPAEEKKEEAKAEAEPAEVVADEKSTDEIESK